ncbi:MAG: calcium-translocating P-type ATPase, PMCA-type [Bacteroidales bacterium]|nr:calcium-translocating P-type ATPase, PMCA-type [Bacteroidales bacterium]
MVQNKVYSGLTDKEVLNSRKEHGVNILTPKEKDSLLKKFFEKFTDPLIVILLIAGALSVGISFYEYFGLSKGGTVFFEPVGIFVAILLATGLAFIFELKADKEFSILNKVNDDELVQVIRNSNAIQIPKKDIVVGDIIILTTGQEIPADAELLECVSLNVDESSLTGEPICTKTITESNFDDDATYPSNHVMRGTKVMEGHGIAKVFAVGDRTQQGKVFEATQIDDSVKTPLNEQLDKLADLITKVSYGFAGLIVLGRIIMYFVLTVKTFVWVDFVAYLLQTIMIAVTLIVVAVPEGLPMAVTLSLAYSMKRMLKTNNLVRKMHACETMGASTVICTDKTGTLTQNQMKVAQTNFYGLQNQQLSDNEISTLIKESLSVNTTAQLDFTNKEKPIVLGSPTEGALLLWLYANGINYTNLRNSVEVIKELPFSTERKYMASTVKSAIGKNILFVTGAPEIVLSLCSNIEGNVNKGTVTEQLLDYQNQAMRTLGFAYKFVEDNDISFDDRKVLATDLMFMGVVAIADPVRQDVPEAIKECVDAGINVKIVTGDTIGTAKKIASQIGLWTDRDSDNNIITGEELSAISEKELLERVMDLKIIYRARPMDKKRLIEALQKKDQVVAVTGDGTNDAPALKQAHVGLSMGDGTSVAKEASDITIIDNSFSSIGRAVMWGRSLYQNIQRFILFQMTVNVAACFIVVIGAFLGTESPLTVTQMLWVNLIMDTFAAMALASLPPTHKVMYDKPRNRSAFILNKSMIWNILFVGGIFFILLLILLLIFQHAEIDGMKNLLSFTWGEHDHLSSYELSMFFTIFVMLQFWNMFNARAFETGRSAFHFKNCGGFGIISFIILIGQILIITFGGQMFNVESLKLIDWVIIVTSTSLVLWVGELVRLFNKRYNKNDMKFV